MDAETVPPPPPPAPSVRALTCPSCGGTIELRAAGYTVTVACQYCSSLLDVANPDVRLITEYHLAMQGLEIPLGTRGTLRGVEWEAIGYVQRSEGGAYPWEEYLLFNPYHGYRWLITNGRGWSFGEMLTRTPTWEASHLSVDGESYDHFFANGQAQVDYVVGEFYWRVKVGETVSTDDYVRPGRMLSREANEEEVSWTRSDWLPPSEIEAAFPVRAPRHPSPPLPHQPSPYRGVVRTGLGIGMAAIVFLIFAAIFFGGGKTHFERDVRVVMGVPFFEALGPITLDRSRQIVQVHARAPGLEQGWIDLEYTLVNRATQATYEAYKTAERYSGRDSDGDWTEGSRSATAKFASIPAGTYDLLVNYSAQRWSGGGYYPDRPLTMTIRVSSGGVFVSNVILAILFILLPIFYFLMRHLAFEHARQAESDFGVSGAAALFESSDDDEEED